MNRIPLSLPRETTCRESGSSALNPTKHPAAVFLVVVESCGGDTVAATMFGGTSVRMGWSLTEKVEASSFMEGGNGLGSPFSWRVVKLGAMKKL